MQRAKAVLGVDESRIRVFFVAVIASALILAGCGNSDNDKSSTTTSGSSDDNNTETTAGNAALKTIASREGVDKDVPLQLEINSLKRTGPLAVLTFTVRNTYKASAGENTATKRWQAGDFFDDGSFGEGTKVRSTVDGVYFIDTANLKKYLVVRDDKGDCTCTSDTARVFANPGQAATFSATYGAPPSDVKKVDLFVPNFGTFNDIPVS